MSVTTVPLRPVSKGGLWLLWIGVAALLAIAAGVAWSQTRVNGFEVVKAGEGPSPTDEDIVLIKYTGRLSDGTVFDQPEQAPLPVAGLVEGFAEVLKQLHRVGRYKIIIPPEKGYQDQDAGATPPNSTPYFAVALHAFRPAAEAIGRAHLRPPAPNV